MRKRCIRDGIEDSSIRIIRGKEKLSMLWDDCHFAMRLELDVEKVISSGACESWQHWKSIDVISLSEGSS